MIGKKIFATIAAIVMLAAAFVVIENVTNVNIISETAQGAVTPGITDWEGNHSSAAWNADILNMTATEKAGLYVGQTGVRLEFNGNVLTSTGYHLYKPTYNSNTTGDKDVWIDWNRVGSINEANEPYITGVTLDRPGLWLVCPFEDSPISNVNMSNMSVQGPSPTETWYNITAWFWVNSSTNFDIELSTDTAYYDHNTSIIVTIKDGAGALVTGTWYVDIWNVYNIEDTSGIGMERLCAHRKATDGALTLTGAEMYQYTHSTSYGTGTYQIRAYQDTVSGSDEADAIYGGEVDYTYNGQHGWNETFGDTTYWSSRFISTGTTTRIVADVGNHVDTDIWNDARYKYATCGPYAPPGYLTDKVNITVEKGEPSVSITDNDTIFWNDSFDKRVQVKVRDFAGSSIDVTGSGWTVELYNRSQKPSTSTYKAPIPAGCYNLSYSDDGSVINITAAWNGTWNNRWGWNSSIGDWAPKGRVYVLIRGHTVGNSSEEWNNTAKIANAFFTLATASNRFVWVDDGQVPSDDGEYGAIPAIASGPIDIQFQIQGSDYYYFGDTSNSGFCKTVEDCAANITISGDSLFTGTLDKYINYADSWFASATGTWTVPIIPLMDIGGGTITITANAWNATIQEELSIGGTNYLSNGTIVTVTPNRFNIDEVNQTLEVTVQSAAGQDLPGATVRLYYIDESAWDAAAGPMDGANQMVDEMPGNWGLTETSFHFNTTQQTSNQTSMSGLSAIQAPRNLTVYAFSGTKYGYAKIRMDPNSDLEVEMSQSTFVAGYPYEEVTINCTFAGNSTDTPSTATADKANFAFYIYDEDGEEVTDTIFAGAGFTSTDLDDQYSITLDNLYAINPGTYSVYAKNLTHDSEGNNATFTVVPVEVTSDVSAFIWKYDDNISATFTVLGDYNMGTLRIDNISLTGGGAWNKTFTNTTFDSADGSTGDDLDATNNSIEIPSNELVDGSVTIYDITPDHLPTSTAMENVTFWFRPENEDTSVEGGWARCSGKVPVQVPNVNPNPMFVPYGTTSTVEITATGRTNTEYLEDVYIGLNGRGLTVAEYNGTTGANGKIYFNINPSTTGNIDIHVGEENRIVSTKIVVTSKALQIDAPIKVNEGAEFTVTVYDEGTTTPVVGASVALQGLAEPKTTDASGQVTFTAPMVEGGNMEYDITATYTAEGYVSDTVTISVINIPQLSVGISPSATVGKGCDFTVTVSKDDAAPAVNAAVTFNGATYHTSGTGSVTLTAPEEPGEYPITATFGSFLAGEETLIVSGDDELSCLSPGFELLTLVIALGVAFILLRRRKK